MYLIPLVAILFGTASAAHAAWEHVSKDSDKVIYMDKATAERNANFIKTPVLFDYVERRKQGHLSMRLDTEYDCAIPRERDVGVTLYAENMGKGKVISTSTPQDPWKPVKAGSLGEKIYTAACKKETAAQGRWKYFFKNDGEPNYYDPASIQREGAIIKVLQLQDFKEPLALEKSTARSSTTEMHFDCRKRLVESANGTFYSGAMASGKVVHVDHIGQSSPFAENAAASALAKLVCK